MFCTTEAPTVPGMPDSPSTPSSPSSTVKATKSSQLAPASALTCTVRSSPSTGAASSGTVMRRRASRTTTPSKGLSETSRLEPPPTTTQGQAFGIGFLHGFDESHARGRLDEMGDGAATPMVVMSAKLVMAYYLSGAGAISRQSSAETAERPRLNEGGAGFLPFWRPETTERREGFVQTPGFRPFLTRCRILIPHPATRLRRPIRKNPAEWAGFCKAVILAINESRGARSACRSAGRTS